MSTDDCLSCPVCEGLPDHLRDGVDKYYGKVDEKEYDRLKREYNKMLQSNPVRVDYEYTINADLSISLYFLGICNNCHAKWEHKGMVK